VPSLASRAAAADALKPLFNAFPLPNGPDTVRGLAQFSASYADPSTLDATSVRVDWTFGTALTLFGRYNYAPSNASSRLGSFAFLGVNSIGTLQNSLQTLTTGATWMLSPTLSNELRFNWSRNAAKNFQTIDTFGGAIVPASAILHPGFAPGESAYQFNLSGTDAAFADGLNADNVQRQINVVDTVALSKRRHQLKFGIDFRHFFPVYGPLNYVQSYIFNGATGALAGAASSVTVASPSGDNRYPNVTNFSAYAQDMWSPTSSLTLAYGVRWEVNPPAGLRNSNEALTLTSADPGSMALAPPGTPMYQTTWNNFAPRLGAAYRLRDAPGRETVLRGGWGVFFDLGSNSAIDNLATSFPFVARRSLANVPFPIDPALQTPPTIAPGARADFLLAPDPHLKLPYTHQWNVAVEQALGATSTVSVSYVGALGRRLLREELLVNPTPLIQNLFLIANDGHSRYNALQARYSRRLSRGLQALVSYTLASSMDNGSNDTIFFLPAVRVNPEQDWGPSDFDVRHTLSGGVTYAIPASPQSPVWRAIVSNWSVDGIFVARSALPVNVVTGTTAFGVPSVLRPDLVPGVQLYVNDPTAPDGQRFNRGAFAPPPLDASGNNPLRQGTLERNALRGFAMSQVDLAVHRDIPLGRGTKIQLRVEVFNLFDQVRLRPPDEHAQQRPVRSGHAHSGVESRNGRRRRRRVQSALSDRRTTLNPTGGQVPILGRCGLSAA
jgi:hypothetical protein